MTALLQLTARPMTLPPLWGSFHILFLVLGAIAALIFSRLAAGCGERGARRIYLTVFVILAAGEIYKQLFSYYIVMKGSYDWWIFPFQLCSMPIYLTPLAAFLPDGRARRTICTFLMDFSLLGAIATLAYPAGIMREYLALTLHGFLWHIVLLFLGLFILMHGDADLSARGFFRTLPLFGLCCALAELFNCLFHSRGEINMFYISPFEISTQPVFSDIDRILSRPAGIALYLLAAAAGAGLLHFLAGRCSRHAGRTRK